MAYNSGVLTLFNQAANTNSPFSDSINPTFSFTESIDSLFGVYINPVVKINSTGSIVNLYCQSVVPTINIANGTISQFTTVNVIGPQSIAGQITSAYSLYVNPFSGAGTVVNNFTAYFEGSVGIGTTSPLSALDVAGSVAVGTFAGNISATVSQLIIPSSLGIATATPSYMVDVNGIAAATQMFSPQTTHVNQMAALSLGFDQGKGGGMVGTKKFINTLSSSVFDINANVSTLAGGCQHSAYDGRYIYMGPYSNTVLVRYDSFRSFSSSSSYQFFDLNNVVSSLSGGSNAIGFDGKYIYLQVFPFYFIRYDTCGVFTSTFSYGFFDLSLLNSNVSVCSGAVYDGNYVYISTYVVFPALIRYNKNLSFVSVSSYEIFVSPPSSIGVDPNGYNAGVFDGRYIYYTPQTSAGYYNIVRYDTFAPFSVSSSYDTFNLWLLVDNYNINMKAAIFTGRYVYFIPYDAETIPGHLVRYDTTLSFSSTSSYSMYYFTPYYSYPNSPLAAAFDGRYLCIFPWPYIGSAAPIVRYDTLLPFTASTSYLVSDLSLFMGTNKYASATFDGRYIYTCSWEAALIVRIDSYAAPQATYLNALSAPQGLTLLDGGGINLVEAATSGSAISGTVVGRAVPSLTAGYMVMNINGTSRKIPVYNQ